MCNIVHPYLQDQLPEGNGARVCFGCGADNVHGLRIKSWVERGKCLCRFHPEPHHTAFPGVVNGGVIATVLDCHGIWTAVAYYQEKYGKAVMFVTRKLTVEYLKPTPLGPELFLEGRVVDEGKRSLTVELELRVGDEVTARAKLVGVQVVMGDKEVMGDE
ncbi:MAG: PaaI family thioesterase [Acidobacteria bacterium]|nr:MAG: PaaI family thioesterase [Acidobacteriota bacterium]RLE24055.1 MAG: PaaI family thioesterase [Acidobacteriota bacterium]